MNSRRTARRRFVMCHVWMRSGHSPKHPLAQPRGGRSRANRHRADALPAQTRRAPARGRATPAGRTR
jgi:hypothetical protein